MNISTKPSVRLRLMAGAFALSLLAPVGLVAVTTQPAQAAEAAPANLRAAYVATQGVGLRWNKAGVDAYRVRISTSSNMKSNTKAWDVLGRELEWTHMNPNPSVSSARLTPGGTYYFQVKSIGLGPTSGSRASISGYSKALKVTLPKTGNPELKPANLKATSAGPDAMYVSWSDASPRVRYILRYTDNPTVTVSKWKKVVLDTAGGVVSGLKPNTRYYFRSRAIDYKGKAVSAYSKSGDSGVTSPKGTARRISLVSYNVLKLKSANDWSARRKPVADTIKSQTPDVVALQEAMPFLYNGVKQHDDIVKLLGKNYALTNTTSSSGTKLAYNKSRLSLQRSGVKALNSYGSTSRYATWAIFKDKESKKEFFVINTHLEPGAQVVEFNAWRVSQAEEILGLIRQNAGQLPVVVAGDMNSSRSASPENGQYRIFTGAGYIDPLDNATMGWDSGRNAASEHLFGEEYNSANNLAASPRRTAYPVGTVIDYIYTSGEIRVGTWRTVVKVDATGKFAGTIPSDHNMLAVNLNLN